MSCKSLALKQQKGVQQKYLAKISIVKNIEMTVLHVHIYEMNGWILHLKETRGKGSSGPKKKFRTIRMVLNS